jgi:hypothetical protein
LEFFEPKKSHHFVDLNELILKIYTVLEFEILLHKIIEENWKQYCAEISYSLFLSSGNITLTVVE